MLKSIAAPPVSSDRESMPVPRVHMVRIPAIDLLDSRAWFTGKLRLSNATACATTFPVPAVTVRSSAVRGRLSPLQSTLGDQAGVILTRSPNPAHMNIAVVAYPMMDDADLYRISTFRKKHDPQSVRIGVHFTLVFPVEGSPSELASEIAAVTRSIDPIAFAIRRTEIVYDALENRSLVFLVPEEGALEITTLHNRLYAGVLRSYLRADIAFVPHLTIGAAAESSVARAAAAELDVGSRVFRGRIEQIALVNVGLPIVQTVATYALGDAAGPGTDTAMAGHTPE